MKMLVIKFIKYLNEFERKRKENKINLIMKEYRI
jgi:hypothetical protein